MVVLLRCGGFLCMASFGRRPEGRAGNELNSRYFITLSRERKGLPVARPPVSFYLFCVRRWVAIGWVVFAIGCDGSSVDELLQKLDTGDVYERKRAREALVLMGAPAIPGLRERLVGEVPGLRLHAVRALGAIDPLPLDAIARALAHDDPAVRSEAGIVLVREGPSALPAFDEALRSPDHNVREDALLVLAQIGPSALSQIDRGLTDQDGRVRRTAVAALAAVGEPARSRLESLAGGEDAGVRRDALRALRGLDGEPGRS